MMDKNEAGRIDPGLVDFFDTQPEALKRSILMIQGVLVAHGLFDLAAAAVVAEARIHCHDEEGWKPIDGALILPGAPRVVAPGFDGAPWSVAEYGKLYAADAAEPERWAWLCDGLAIKPPPTHYLRLPPFP